MPPGAGHLKTDEAAPLQAFGGSEGLGARSPRGKFRNPAGLRPKWGCRLKAPQEPPKSNGGAPPDFLFKSPMPPEPFGKARSKESPGGHEGEGQSQI